MRRIQDGADFLAPGAQRQAVLSKRAMQIVMPRLGESIVEGVLVRWRVAPGDRITRGQIVAEVETDKATTEIPAPEDGVVLVRLVEEGATVPVGAEILRYAGAHLAPRPEGRSTSPAARRVALEHGVDLARVEGSGHEGRVTREDVLAASKQTKPARYQPRPEDRVVPFTRKRAFIAEHLVESLATAAHAACVAEIDMSRVVAARWSLTAFAVHAVARALGDHPELNASVNEKALVLRAERNIGVAVDTDEGLVVPVIHGADRLGVSEISSRIADLAERARSGRLRAEDVADGSFTISNPGREGNLFGISIIRQPEVAILRMGAVIERPVVVGDQIAIRPMMYAALSYDHRAIDGRKANAFLARVRTIFEET